MTDINTDDLATRAERAQMATDVARCGSDATSHVEARVFGNLQ
jgi:hypothetical protein